MRTIKLMILTLILMILTLIMAAMIMFGGLMTTQVCAEEQTDVNTPFEAVETEESGVVVVDDSSVEIAEEEVTEEPTESTEDIAEEFVDNSPKGIIESQTGLQVDYIKTIDSYNDWGAYYCHCDGDLYCITIDDGSVDVCAILN